MGKKHTTHNKSSKIPLYDDAGYQFRQRMVWTTVLFLGVSVFGMWGWHMRTVVYDAARGSLGQSTPLDTAGAHFDEAMLIAGAREDNDTILPIQTTTTIAEETPEEDTSPPTSTLDDLISTLQAQLPPTTTPETSPQ